MSKKLDYSKLLSEAVVNQVDSNLLNESIESYNLRNPDTYLGTIEPFAKGNPVKDATDIINGGIMKGLSNPSSAISDDNYIAAVGTLDADYYKSLESPLKASESLAKAYAKYDTDPLFEDSLEPEDGAVRDDSIEEDDPTEDGEAPDALEEMLESILNENSDEEEIDTRDEDEEDEEQVVSDDSEAEGAEVKEDESDTYNNKDILDINPSGELSDEEVDNLAEALLEMSEEEPEEDEEEPVEDKEACPECGEEECVCDDEEELDEDDVSGEGVVAEALTNLSYGDKIRLLRALRESEEGADPDVLVNGGYFQDVKGGIESDEDIEEDDQLNNQDIMEALFEAIEEIEDDDLDDDEEECEECEECEPEEEVDEIAAVTEAILRMTPRQRLQMLREMDEAEIAEDEKAEDIEDEEVGDEDDVEVDDEADELSDEEVQEALFEAIDELEDEEVEDDEECEECESEDDEELEDDTEEASEEELTEGLNSLVSKLGRKKSNKMLKEQKALEALFKNIK